MRIFAHRRLSTKARRRERRLTVYATLTENPRHQQAEQMNDAVNREAESGGDGQDAEMAQRSLHGAL
jgi:hypothetical protein